MPAVGQSVGLTLTGTGGTGVLSVNTMSYGWYWCSQCETLTGTGV